jgi:S-adenosyl-L-methionine-dependent methyltransferase
MTTPESKILEMTPFGRLVETADGSLTVCHGGHGQNFHSTEGAKLEAWQLYVVASGYLLEIEQDGLPIQVLDVGMGLSYNAAAAIAAWVESSGRRDLIVTSLESEQSLVEAVASGEAPWFLGWQDPWMAGPKALRRQNSGEFVAMLRHPKSEKKCSWRILVGDGASVLLGLKNVAYNFIWQDPFTPELNPTMWSAAWFSAVRVRAAPGARMVTYSVARLVKESMEGGGWLFEKIKTPTRKRNWALAINSRASVGSKTDLDLVGVHRP